MMTLFSRSLNFSMPNCDNLTRQKLSAESLVIFDGVFFAGGFGDRGGRGKPRGGRRGGGGSDSD